MVYVIQVCWLLAQAVSKPVWHIPLLCVQWKTPDDGQTCKVLFQKWIWETGASGWFYYKNLSRYTVTWTSKECAELNNLPLSLCGCQGTCHGHTCLTSQDECSNAWTLWHHKPLTPWFRVDVHLALLWLKPLDDAATTVICLVMLDLSFWQRWLRWLFTSTFWVDPPRNIAGGWECFGVTCRIHLPIRI